MPCEKGSSMVRRFSIPPLHRQRLSSQPPRCLTPSNFFLCSHHRHSCLEGRREGAEGREGAVITWGSKTGCGQQRDISSNPLHSNPESGLSQRSKAPECLNHTSGRVKLKSYHYICCHPTNFLLRIHNRKLMSTQLIWEIMGQTGMRYFEIHYFL